MISVHTDGGSEEMKLHTEHKTDSQAHIHNSMITAERERGLLYTTGSLLMPLSRSLSQSFSICLFLSFVSVLFRS